MKRVSALLFTLALLLLCCACAPTKTGESAGTTPGGIVTNAKKSGDTGGLSEAIAADISIAANTSIATDAAVSMDTFNPEALLSTDGEPYANQYEAFIGMLDGLYRQGQYFEAYGLQRPAAFLYGAGSAASGAMRLCLECVLFLKGEGESLDEISMGRYADWSSLARISPASPYPDYFEGLVYQMQGNTEKATEYFTRAITFPSWPEEGWDFTYLKMLPTDELYLLRDGLLAIESAFSKASLPVCIPIERDLYNFSSAYLIARAGEAVTAGNNALAYDYAVAAVSADPFDGNAYAAAAVTGMALGDSATAATYVNEGLYIDPTHEGLQTLLAAFDTEGA